MTTKQQTLREAVKELLSDFACETDSEYGDTTLEKGLEEYVLKLLTLFQKTMEDKVIGEEEKVSKEHAMSEIIRNELRRKQFRALQSIISGEKI